MPPLRPNLVQYVDFLGKEIGRNLLRLSAERHIQAVGQAVGNVGTDYERALTELAATQRRGCSDGCLAYAALT